MFFREVRKQEIQLYQLCGMNWQSGEKPNLPHFHVHKFKVVLASSELVGNCVRFGSGIIRRSGLVGARGKLGQDQYFK